MRNISRFLRYTKFNCQFWHDFLINLCFLYHSIFFGSLIFRGKKILAFNMFLNIKRSLKIKENFDPWIVFLVSMMKISPSVLLVPVKRSGIVQGIPFPITQRKKVTLTVKWIVKLLKDSNKVINVSKMVDLLVSSIYGRGITIAQKKLYYVKAVSNRGLLRFLK